MKQKTPITIGWRIITLALIILVIVSAGCRTRRVYVPVETVRTEYQDRILRDSIRLYDSIYIRETGDTIRIEKYKYLYRDKLVRDSIYRTDSVQVPYPVVEYREVNRLTGWQNFEVWCGRIEIVMALIAALVFYLQRKKTD